MVFGMMDNPIIQMPEDRQICCQKAVFRQGNVPSRALACEILKVDTLAYPTVLCIFDLQI